ncbi:hypothetical protein B0H10DRAFT_2427276 [Mycena sp. CBHHK59/15]|nr:hypothetical protein B0H10DRAFT_2427276 [Mycena sp. CBHHK59/15]
MNLSSLLLASAPKKIDKELDDLFKSNPAPPRKPATPIQAPTSGSAPPAKKRKIEPVVHEPQDGRKKRAKASAAPEAPPKVAKTTSKPTPTKKSKRKLTPVEVDNDEEEEEEDDEDNSDLENAYLGKKRAGAKPTADAPSENSDEDEGDDAPDDAEESEDADSESDAPPPVHESLTKRVRTKPAKKTKVVPEGETPAQRDARTLFVGGLPVEVAQKKPLQKQLTRHILSFLSSSSKIKIESTRFRSVAFRDPTSSTALSTTTPAPTPATSTSTSAPAATNHGKERASTWRQSGAAADEKADGDTKKEYLTPAQKKKILFIQGAIHPEAGGVNAYVVLAHPLPSEGPADAAADETDTPYGAAQHLARAANLSQFLERTLRVDVCAHAPDDSGPAGDPKLSIFLGNLDFASREDDVREFFEGVLAAERGPAPDGARWVQGVRLVRDRETQLGKGFGYVRLADRECVDEILSLAKTDEGQAKLKFAKRKLRVQRCRAVKPTAASPAAPKSKSTYPGTPPKRGDPTLGARLAHLDKDARKAAKKADPDRVGRRAEKKKLGAKIRMGAAGDKVRAVAAASSRSRTTAGGGRRIGGGAKGVGGKGKGKDGERERRARVNKNTGGFKGKK